MAHGLLTNWTHGRIIIYLLKGPDIKPFLTIRSHVLCGERNPSVLLMLVRAFPRLLCCYLPLESHPNASVTVLLTSPVRRYRSNYHTNMGIRLFLSQACHAWLAISQRRVSETLASYECCFAILKKKNSSDMGACKIDGGDSSLQPNPISPSSPQWRIRYT